MIYVIISYQQFDDISYSFKLKIIFMGECVWGFPILALDTLSSWEGGRGNPILRPRYSLYLYMLNGKAGSDTITWLPPSPVLPPFLQSPPEPQIIPNPRIPHLPSNPSQLTS